MDFWNTFFLLLIYIPLIMVWGFAVLDIFRRDDIHGGSKALWLVVVIFLIMRQPGSTPEERQALADAQRDYVAQAPAGSPVEQIKVLSDLHDRGKLTDSEFESEKARILQGSAT